MIIGDELYSIEVYPFVEFEERFTNLTSIKTCTDALNRAKLGSVPEIRVALRRS